MALSRDDARSFLAQVKEVFGSDSPQYYDFLIALKQQQTGEIGINECTQRITRQFVGHPDLIESFNAFLPEEYKVQVVQEVQVVDAHQSHHSDDQLDNEEDKNEVENEHENEDEKEDRHSQTSPATPEKNDTDKNSDSRSSGRKQKRDEIVETTTGDLSPVEGGKDEGNESAEEELTHQSRIESEDGQEQEHDSPPSKKKMRIRASPSNGAGEQETNVPMDSLDGTKTKTVALSPLKVSVSKYDDPLSEEAVAQANVEMVTCKICKGKRNSIAISTNEPILLCEQKGCNCEYHLGCLPRSLFSTAPKNSSDVDAKRDDDDANSATSLPENSLPEGIESDSSEKSETQPIDQIPEGDIYCAECKTDGATAVLNKYFDRCDTLRSHFSCSREYVLRLLQKHMLENPDGNVLSQGNNDQDSENGRKEETVVTPVKDGSSKNTPSMLRPPPKSELWYAHELHNLAMSSANKSSSSAAKEQGQLNSKEDDRELLADDSAEFLIGKPVRLYCPLDNTYHLGRIIDWRTCSAYPSSNTPSNSHTAGKSIHVDELEYYGNVPISQSEFLLRFPAGMEGRKTPLQKWVILEEHSLAVGISLIQGQTSKLKGRQRGWVPAMILARSALELVTVRRFLHESEDGELFAEMKRDSSSKHSSGSKADSSQKDLWALASFFGEEAHALLRLRDEATCLPFPPGGGSSDTTNPRSSTGTLYETENDGSCCLNVPLALALAEYNEQERCREWCKLILENSKHRFALTSCDEYSIQRRLEEEDRETLKQEKQQTESKNPDNEIPQRESSISAEMSLQEDSTGVGTSNPLIERGIDRFWLSQLSGINCNSRDTLISFKCEDVPSMSSAMSALNGHGGS